MKQVSDSEFYRELYDQEKDIDINCVQTNPDIISEFKFKSNRELFGKSISKGYGERKYFINTSRK